MHFNSDHPDGQSNGYANNYECNSILNVTASSKKRGA